MILKKTFLICERYLEVAPVLNLVWEFEWRNYSSKKGDIIYAVKRMNLVQGYKQNCVKKLRST